MAFLIILLIDFEFFTVQSQFERATPVHRTNTASGSGGGGGSGGGQPPPPSLLERERMVHSSIAYVKAPLGFESVYGDVARRVRLSFDALPPPPPTARAAAIRTQQPASKKEAQNLFYSNINDFIKCTHLIDFKYRKNKFIRIKFVFFFFLKKKTF